MFHLKKKSEEDFSVISIGLYLRINIYFENNILKIKVND